jgi:hypothetical protein
MAKKSLISATLLEILQNIHQIREKTMQNLPSSSAMSLSKRDAFMSLTFVAFILVN